VERARAIYIRAVSVSRALLLATALVLLPPLGGFAGASGRILFTEPRTVQVTP